MPTVPISSPVPNAAPSALPGARSTPNLGTHNAAVVADTYTPQLANQAAGALHSIGQDLLQIQQKEKAQADQMRVNDAMNKAMQAKLDLTYGQNGFLQLRGQDALERPEGQSLGQEYSAKLEQTLGDISAGLGNEDQRRAFKLQSSQMAVQFRGDTAQHTFKEYDSWSKSVNTGTIQTAQQQMGLAWNDPEQVAQGKGAIQAATYALGKQQGWSAAQTESIMTANLSAGHAVVIAEAANAKNIDYAKEYFAQNKAEMLPEARLHAEKTLEVGDFETKTQDAAGKLYAESKGDVAAALEQARKQYTGKEEDAIVTRIKGLDGERVALRERSQADAADSAWRTYASTGSLSSIPPSTIAAMDGKQLEALRRTARVDQEARLANREVKTDPNVYYALSAAAGGDPDFKNQDLRPFFDKLSPADRKHFIDKQTSLSNPAKADQVVAVDSQKSAMVKTLELKGEQAGVFLQQADKALFAAQQEKGKPLDQAERQKVLDKLALQGEVLSGHWYTNDPNMRYYEALASGQEKQFTAQFSDADRRRATAALQRQGVKNPTKQQIDTVLQTAYRVK